MSAMALTLEIKLWHHLDFRIVIRVSCQREINSYIMAVRTVSGGDI